MPNGKETLGPGPEEKAEKINWEEVVDKLRVAREKFDSAKTEYEGARIKLLQPFNDLLENRGKCEYYIKKFPLAFHIMDTLAQVEQIEHFIPVPNALRVFAKYGNTEDFLSGVEEKTEEMLEDLARVPAFKEIKDKLHPQMIKKEIIALYFPKGGKYEAPKYYGSPLDDHPVHPLDNYFISRAGKWAIEELAKKFKL